MVQLWINLPKSYKMTIPKYQAIVKSNIPTLELRNISLRIISGDYKGLKGPAKTFTNLNILILQQKKRET